MSPTMCTSDARTATCLGLAEGLEVKPGEAHELLAREWRAARAALVAANVARAEREARESEGEGGAKRRRTEVE